MYITSRNTVGEAADNSVASALVEFQETTQHSRTCCFQRHLARATSTFCPAKPVHRRPCWLTCYAQSHRHACVKLRHAALSERADITNPTKTYGPYCTCRCS